MKWYSQTYIYDDPWPTVTLAYFLRYPNPYASHILSCDVISRSISPDGNLKTSRLLLKKGVLPKWTRKFVAHPEAWVMEESEVDPYGKTVKCTTRNLNHVKVLQVVESLRLQQTASGQTVQHSDACLISRIGWGFSKRIESLGLNKVKAHIQRSPETISFILSLMRTSRLQPLTLSNAGASATSSDSSRSVLMQNPQQNPNELAATAFSYNATMEIPLQTPPSQPSWWTNLKIRLQGR